MLLDTCALIWLASGEKRLSQETMRRLDDAPVVYLSAISGFEIGLRCKSGKLKLPLQPMEWLSQIVKHHGLSVLDLSLEVCAGATLLPPIHRDPCDRLIIATALHHNFTVVTGDERFSEYGIEVLS